MREVDRQLARCGLTNKGDHSAAAAERLVVAVSGGADSVALLLAILALQTRRKRESCACDVIVAHVHHHLRDSADEDAKWVVDLCERLGVTVLVEHVHPASLKGNVSASARRLRYDALKKVAARSSARHIAVAHHAEDQLETMLMAMCRGAGPLGLAGMPMTRRLGNVTLIRPLLSVRKRDCEDLCREAGVVWREDPGNGDVTKRRARLRRDVTPVLEELWPGAAKRAAANAEIMRAALDALLREVGTAFGLESATRWPRELLKALGVGVLATGLRRAVTHAQPNLADRVSNATLLRAARAIQSDDRRPREFRFSGGMICHVTAHAVEVRKEAPRRV